MATAAQMTPDQQNMIARGLVLRDSVLMKQQIASITVTPSQQSVINVQPHNVGLTVGFLVVVSAGVTNGATNTATLTPFGAANLLSSITYTDLSNVNRIQTTGYHIALLNTARQGWAFGGAYAPNLPIGYGNNWNVFQGPATIAGAGTGTVKAMYHIPLAYSGTDLRGSVYSSVINATQNLSLTINTTPFVGATDPLNAIYSGNAAGGYTGTVTVTVYQIFRDQIPTNNGLPILPLMDLNTVYDIKNTTLTGIAVSQDFPFSFPSMRQFLSTFAVFDNGGTFNGGSDVNYWSLVSANNTQLWRLDPYVCALFARQALMSDPPLGTYYFDFRDKPIDTINYGNMNLNLNASTVNTNAQVVYLTEAFQQVNQIPYASSLQVR